MNTYKELVILIVEDDDGHADLIAEGLQESGICNRMIRFRDGQEAWDFFQEENYSPDFSFLMLLDINMPRMNGVELLNRIKLTNKLKNIPVIMLTTTDDLREIEQCYKIGCSVYITKPVDFIKFNDTLKRLGLFIQIVKV